MDALREPHSSASELIYESQSQGQPQHSPAVASPSDGGWVASASQAQATNLGLTPGLDLRGEEERKRGVIRKRVTEIVQDAVERLGREVSGELLGREGEGEGSER